MLYALQQSAFSGFRYDILNAERQRIGQLVLPDYPLAKNARLRHLVPKNASTKITFELMAEHYEVTYEYLNRQWENDIRFSLLQRDVQLATVDIVGADSEPEQNKALIQRKRILMTKPFQAQLVKHTRFFGAMYEFQMNQRVIGKIYEPKWMTFKRQVAIDLPETMSLPVQVFLFFIMQNHAYG